MPGLKIENFGSGDMTWLGSTHGLRNARTVTLDPTNFAALAVDGVIPSGTSLALKAGVVVPFNAAGSGGEEKLVGFLLTAVSVAKGKQAVALFDHGRVIVAKLPKAFTAPATGNDLTNIVFVK